MTGSGHCSDPRVTHLLEDAGLAVPLTMVLATVGGISSTSKRTYDNAGETIADQELSSGSVHGTDAMMKSFETGARMMKLDGFVASYPYNCRPGALSSHVQKKYLEEKTGLPVLALEIDMFDSRSYSAESLRIKVETFAYMLKNKKQSAGT
jgi:benzoyl-CoA reductase/2-hydroxyglutaryl-CoA dehydratase subunit BcrC/BadD/HgdB